MRRSTTVSHSDADDTWRSMDVAFESRSDSYARRKRLLLINALVLTGLVTFRVVGKQGIKRFLPFAPDFGQTFPGQR